MEILLIVAVTRQHLSDLPLRNCCKGFSGLTASSYGAFAIPVLLTLRPGYPQAQQGYSSQAKPAQW